MAAKKVKQKKVPTKSRKLSKNFKGTTLKLGDIFSFSTKGAAKKNFSSSFEYENFMVDLKSNVKNGKAKLNVKIDGKTFNFSGEVTISEKAFNNLCALSEHLLSSVTSR